MATNLASSPDDASPRSPTPASRRGPSFTSRLREVAIRLLSAFRGSPWSIACILRFVARLSTLRHAYRQQVDTFVASSSSSSSSALARPSPSGLFLESIWQTLQALGVWFAGRFAFEIVLANLRARRAKARRGEKWRGAMRRALALKDLRQRRIGGGTFVELSRGKTHYHLSGPEDGPLVVLCHGFGVFSYVYSDLADVLSRSGYRVLSFDWYGYGYSDAPNPRRVRYDRFLFVGQLAELLYALQLQDSTFTLAGHSMGGLIAAYFAAQYPQRVKNLVLICPAGTPYVSTPNSQVFVSIQILQAIKLFPSPPKPSVCFPPRSAIVLT